MKSDHLKKSKLPDKPGVYFFLKGKQILYIGKATSLRDRTKSYFSKDLIHTRGPLILDMAFKSDKIKWQETDSVLEALILEANLIKKYQPYYNTREKDDKSFNYVCVTKEKLPRIVIRRGRILQNEELIENDADFKECFGPFTNGGQLKEALKIIRPIFPFLDEKSKNYYQFYKQVDLAPDLSDPEAIKQYQKNIKNIKLFFQGKKKQILRDLKKEMMALAKAREFEQAGVVKRQIFALEHINDIALLRKENIRELSPDFVMRIEAYDIAHMGGQNMVGVMTVVENGEAIKSEYKKFKIRTQKGANDTGALMEVLERRLRHQEWTYPGLIAVDGAIAQLNAAQAVLHKMDIKVPVVAVVKDDRHKAKAIMGDEEMVSKYKQAILLGNSEAHRFAIAYHKNMRSKNFLK